MSIGDKANFPSPDFDVGAWLQRINLGQYAAAFAQNEINAVALPLLTEEDLKACGVLVLGHRKIILHEIQKLSAGAAAEREAATQPVPGPVATPRPHVPPPSPTSRELPTLRGPDRLPANEELCTEIVIFENEVEVWRKLLEPGEYIFGRDLASDFPIMDPAVSRRHARLTVSPSQWFLEDLGSRSGTALDGFPVQERTNVLPSQTIAIGLATMVLSRVPAPAQPEPVLGPVAKPAPAVPPRPAVKPVSQPAFPQKPPAANGPRPKEVIAAATTIVPPARSRQPRAAAAPPPVEPLHGPRARAVQRSRNVWTRQKVGFWARIAASKFLIVSIAVHFLFGVGAAVYVVQRYQARRKLTFQGGPPLISVSKRVLEHRVSMAKKKNTMSAPAQAKRITTAGLSKVVLPDMPALPEATEIVPKRMAGMGGMGMGPGFGSGGGMGAGLGVAGGTISLPRIVGDRCSAASRAAAMKAGGGDPKGEEAILKGLTFLKSQQNADGSFGVSFKGAMTGLALLSFLGHCEKPTSQEFGPCVRKAIDYLVKTGTENNGKLGKGDGNSWVYEHGIAAYALGEAYIFTREEAIAPVLRMAIKLIIDGQGPDGGWVYGYTKVGDGDTSVTGWQIQALKVAHLSDLNIEGVEPCMKRAVADFVRVQGTKGGFGYRTKSDSWKLTGVGVFCLQIITHQKGVPVLNGLQYLQSKDAPPIKYQDPDANLYAWYYITQACFQAGGYNWGKWNRAFQPELLANQGADGCWNETGNSAPVAEGGFHYSGTGKTADAKVYRTSLCILMLEVYYRYLASNQ